MFPLYFPKRKDDTGFENSQKSVKLYYYPVNITKILRVLLCLKTTDWLQKKSLFYH